MGAILLSWPNKTVHSSDLVHNIDLFGRVYLSTVLEELMTFIKD